MSAVIKAPSLFGRSMWKFLIKQLYPFFDATPEQEQQAFPANYPMVPHIDSRTMGWTHYGVMIPDLPAPHRFFSIMSIIGTPGALAFDNDHALVDGPRHNATVVSGTAATHPHHFGSYSTRRDCQMATDGSRVWFGDDVKISGQYPYYQVEARYGDFVLNIAIENTDKVSWFIKTPVYDHLSLLSRYHGTINWQGQIQEISGLCTFEYAACPSPYLLRDKPLAKHLKAPLDFFCYQIVNLDAQTQLLLSYVCVSGTPAVSKAYLRSLDQYSQSYDIEFAVLDYQAELAVAPDGNAMRLPQTLRWLVAQLDLQLVMQVDTAFTYGLGTGYVGGCAYTGQYRGQDISGRGYIEYIDRRG